MNAAHRTVTSDAEKKKKKKILRGDITTQT